MNNKIVKEVFIILLLCIVIIFTLGLLFYDCIPQKNEKIESAEYVPSKNVTETIEEINANNGANVMKDNNGSLLKSYSIGKDDLTEFASENYYESGKKDPFAEYSTPVEDEIVKTVTTNVNVNNVQSDNQLNETNNTALNALETKEDSKNEVVQNTVVQNTIVEEKETSAGKYFETPHSK